MPERLNKLKIISGDISSANLGLSEIDEIELIESVDIVFHCAASVRFDLSLLDIMRINVKGTQRLLNIAEKLTKLKAFVFVSTAYSQCYQSELKEQHYPTGLNIDELLDCVETSNLKALKEIENA